MSQLRKTDLVAVGFTESAIDYYRNTLQDYACELRRRAILHTEAATAKGIS